MSSPAPIRAAVVVALLMSAAGADARAQTGPQLRASGRPDTGSPRAAVAAPVPSDSTPAASAASLATLVGTVYDSVHAAPLVGAAVLVEGTTRMAFTNDGGGFAIDSIPAGVFRVRVDHVLLDSLGIAFVTDTIRFTENDNRTVALAIPSSESLVGISCPAARRALGPSAIVGRVLDADTDVPVDSAKVSFVWSELSIATGIRRVPRTREALTGADGVYRICGVPNEVEGTLQAIKRGITTAEVVIRFQGEPLLIQGFRIGNVTTVARETSDSATRAARDAVTGPRYSALNVQRGQAVLSGRVVMANGQPIVGARVDVEGTAARTLTRDNGAFTLTELPSGTQKVVARQLGYEPVEVPVELSTRAPATVTITLSKPAQVLETVVVKAAQEEGLERVGFVDRKRSQTGYFITGEEVMERGPNLLTDVFRTVPSLRVVPAGMNEYAIESARSTMLGGNCVKYWMDGAPFEAVFPGDVDRLVQPWNVGGIEVYSGSSTPAQFQFAGSSNCTVIVIWSKYGLEQRTRRPRGDG
jgi:hypothetical protein